MRNLLKALLLGLLLLCCSSLQAATVTHNLFVEVLTGPFTGITGSGFFSYDDATLTNAGEEVLDPTVGDLTIELTVFGQTFHESDDIDFPVFPKLGFTDGVPVFLDFIVTELDGINPVEIDYVGVFFLGIDDLSPVDQDYYAELFVNEHAVPVPAAVWLLGSGLLGLFGLFRRERKHA